MNTPAIQVVAKEGEPALLLNRERRFSFRLNAAPDEIWQEILLSQLGNLSVTFSRQILSFTTIPANLQSRYATLKKTIEETNRLYAQQQQSLIARIKEHEEQEAATPEQREQTQQQVKKLWGDLEL